MMQMMSSNASAVSLAVLACAIALAAPAPAGAAAKLPAPAWPHVKHSGWHGLKVTWKAVEGADGYAVYRWSKAKGKYVRKAWTKKTSWRDTGLKSDGKYRYKVAAYEKVKGKKRVGKRSYWVAAVTYSKGAKTVNAGKPKVECRSLWMELARQAAPEHMGARTHVGASRNGSLVGGGKCAAFSQSVRWVSSDASVVKVVDANGRQEARARRAGSCRLRPVAANGARGPAVEVTVRDLSCPDAFRDPGIYDPEVIEWLEGMRGPMAAVVRASARSGVFGEVWDIGEEKVSLAGTLGTTDARFEEWAGTGSVAKAMKKLLSYEVDGVRPYDIQIRHGLTLFFESDTRVGVTYVVSYAPVYDGVEIAPSWIVRQTVPEP